MVHPTFGGEAYRLGPRIPLFDKDGIPISSHVLFESAPQINARDSTDSDSICNGNNKSSYCEKPYQTKNLRLPIALGIAVPLVCAAIACVWFWNKNRLRERREDQDAAALDFDYGMENGTKNPKNGATPGVGGTGEKGGLHRGQISMDMNLSSPYLLPPKIHESRESLNSLTRTIDTEADPYRPVTQYTNSDVGSLRSYRRDPNDATSLYAPSTRRNTRMSNMPATPSAAVTKDPFEIPPTPHSAKLNHHRTSQNTTGTPPENPFASPHDDNHAGQKKASSTPYPDDNGKDTGLDFGLPKDIQEPPAAMVHGDQANSSNGSWELAAANGSSGYDMPDHSHHLAVELPNQPASSDGGNQASAQLSITIPPASVGTVGHDIPQVAVPYPEDDNTTQPKYPDDMYDDEPRGRIVRRSIDLGAGGNDGGLLSAPANENKRISIGFRPLPPDDIMDNEDPEYRANRIRSFYKEYFEDYTRGGDAPDVPSLPRQYQNGGGSYYEDYDPSYLGDTYLDTKTNAFVMPYAQPVTRRAMTPPPTRGPQMRGPPRFRTDSALGPRSGSSASQMRPGSSASARPRKRGPPPAALSTLPNPAKLGSDTLTLLSATDFAPPSSMADRVAGRSQSPTLEKIQYAPKIPVSTPIIGAFDELASVPSPHMLKSSATLSNLDFAPPRRFKDQDEMSDAGSIRSNRSGLSAIQTQAIRSGAGRVSKLPEDMVFTPTDMSSALKPSWGMRP
ncbi:hypothetical protein CFO_g3875 [Ceratocystis platani]|uniref:Uncharacterized protein n=1 Tax=Ceratocystis fimbriata f. sp. platani TaxID=88771 RepID=A0A0F8AZ82_CERFI|nr:hypothetical protein CFO_g3875 [Ceratocystis platani]